MALHDALAEAPLFLQRRYGSIRTYVRSIIDVEYPDLDIREISGEDIEFIQLVALIFVLHNFLDDGHKAAVRAVKILEELGVNSFTIGNTTFARDNEAVMRGRKLADELLQSISDESLKKLIVTTESLGVLVRELLEGLENG